MGLVVGLDQSHRVSSYCCRCVGNYLTLCLSLRVFLALSLLLLSLSYSEHVRASSQVMHNKFNTKLNLWIMLLALLFVCVLLCGEDVCVCVCACLLVGILHLNAGSGCWLVLRWTRRGVREGGRVRVSGRIQFLEVKEHRSGSTGRVCVCVWR